MEWRGMLLAALAVSAVGCAGHRTASTQDLRMQMAQLDGRVRVLEQSLNTVEGKAWNQREDISYLRGRVEAFQPAYGGPEGTALAQPTPKRIQKALKSAGYYTGPIDGKIGPKTKQAVKSFQSDNHLKVDGVVGRRTWTRLARHLPSD